MSTISSRRPKRIGIVGYHGATNLGDETVVHILIKKLREHYPNAEIWGFSLNPKETEVRHGIRAFPIKWQTEVRLAQRKPIAAKNSSKTGYADNLRIDLFGKLKRALKKWPTLFRSLREVKESVCRLAVRMPREVSFFCRSYYRLKGFDILIVPGSGPLTDWWGGPWMHPYTLFFWSLLSRLTGTKFIALSIGAERLETRIGKCMCKWFLSMAQYRSFRDRYSRDTMKAIGIKGDDLVFPDQGFALLDTLDLNPTEPLWTDERERSRGLVVGVSPVGRMSCVAENDSDSSYRKYIDTLSALVLWLVKREYRIVFCPTDFFQDPPFVEQIICNLTSVLRHEDLAKCILRDPVLTTKDLISRIQMCDIMIASRFHSVVLPFALQKPVLAISYGRKVGDLMSEMNLSDYYCEMDKLELGDTINRFMALEHNRQLVSQCLGQVVSSYRCSLNRQYTDVFGRFR